MDKVDKVNHTTKRSLTAVHNIVNGNFKWLLFLKDNQTIYFDNGHIVQNTGEIVEHPNSKEELKRLLFSSMKDDDGNDNDLSDDGNDNDLSDDGNDNDLSDDGNDNDLSTNINNMVIDDEKEFDDEDMMVDDTNKRKVTFAETNDSDKSIEIDEIIEDDNNNDDETERNDELENVGVKKSKKGKLKSNEVNNETNDIDEDTNDIDEDANDIDEDEHEKDKVQIKSITKKRNKAEHWEVADKLYNQIVSLNKNTFFEPRELICKWSDDSTERIKNLSKIALQMKRESYTQFQVNDAWYTFNHYIEKYNENELTIDSELIVALQDNYRSTSHHSNITKKKKNNATNLRLKMFKVNNRLQEILEYAPENAIFYSDFAYTHFRDLNKKHWEELIEKLESEGFKKDFENPKSVVG